MESLEKTEHIEKELPYDMYSVPGHIPVTPDMVERYWRADEVWMSEIKKSIHDSQNQESEVDENAEKIVDKSYYSADGALKSEVKEFFLKTINAESVTDAEFDEFERKFSSIHRKDRWMLIGSLLNAHDLKFLILGAKYVGEYSVDVDDFINHLDKCLKIDDLRVNVIATQRQLYLFIRDQDAARAVDMVYNKSKSLIESDDPNRQKAGIMMAVNLNRGTKNKYRSLFDIAINKGLDIRVIENPLYYQYQTCNEENFSRHGFDKTGSGLTVVGGSLKGKVVIRHIKPKSFVAWKALYEDHPLWKEKGFDYVPIEPIVSFRLNKKTGNVDVASGVLDLSFGDWLAISDDFKDQINGLISQIKEVLKSAGINHGHTHEDNFVLRFFRDEQGRPDFDRCPRVYLIDFDQAEMQRI